MVDITEALEKATCWNCGESLPDIVYDIDFRKHPIAVIWFDEGCQGGKYEPPEPPTVYIECWKCYSKRLSKHEHKQEEADA